ncbi:hypothetical protein D3C72_1962810 [compost metagenome]
MEGRQMLAFGKQLRDLGPNGRRLSFQGCDPWKLAVLENRPVAHQRGQRDTLAQPIDKAEEGPGIGTGFASRTRVDGLHNRPRRSEPEMSHSVGQAGRAQALRALLAPTVWPGLDLPGVRKLV